MDIAQGVDRASRAERLAWALGWGLVVVLVLLTLRLADAATGTAVLTVDRATVVQAQPFGELPQSVAREVALPDDWDTTRPGFEGRVTYRLSVPESALRATEPDVLQALYLPRACTSVAVRLNGHLLAREGRLDPPLARHCYVPQLVVLPAALVIPGDNMVELELAGHALAHVGARQRAGGLGVVQVGPEPQLRPVWQRAMFWRVQLPELASFAAGALGLFIAGLAWVRRGERGLGYFAAVLLGWAVLGGRLWQHDVAYDHWALEAFFACLLAAVTGCMVLFLQRQGGERHLWVDGLMLLQCVAVPLSIMLAGTDRFFIVVTAWAQLYVIEFALASARFLQRLGRDERHRVWPLATVFGVLVVLAAVEVAVQWGWLPLSPAHYVQFGMPLLCAVVGARLLQQFVQALQAAEAVRAELEQRVNEKIDEIERSYAHLAELRIEQVAEAER
jgi:two-component system sensor histidine kinase UhpB